MKWDEIAVPCDLPETVDEISYERVVMNAAPHGTTFRGTSIPAMPEATAIQRFS
jgi:hypothetical protein